jgi:hypothetical protein
LSDTDRCDDRTVAIRILQRRPWPRCVGRAALGAIAALAPLVIAGCGDDEANVAAPPTCASVVDRAARASETRQQVDLLDDAIVVCRAIEALDVEIRRHAGMIGYDTATFIAGRCDRATDETVTSSAICLQRAAGVPTTTIAVVEEVYEGQTLDGRTVVIRPSDVPFVEGKPEPIVRLVDVALEDGCEALAAEKANWEARIDDPNIGDQASVYARHADNVAVFVGCGETPGTTTTTP